MVPEFQRMFPDDGDCARYLESIRWRDGFACPRCNGTAEPMRLGRPHLLRCRNCKRDISLTAGTVSIDERGDVVETKVAS